jgi:quercetin dioxygenase-like cupin family protein
MATLRGVTHDALSPAPGTPGIVRELAFAGDDVRVLRARGEPGIVSGWHHHGDHDVYGYVAAGTVHFEGGPGGRDRITVGQGDFFHVPAHLVHRERNPSDRDGQEIILFLRGSGPMSVNVDGPTE